jgi:hypothetical protein
MRPFLPYRGSRPGLFYDLSAGESCPLRILPRSQGVRELRFPPLISRETGDPTKLGTERSEASAKKRTKASHQVFQKRPHNPCVVQAIDLYRYD